MTPDCPDFLEACNGAPLSPPEIASLVAAWQKDRADAECWRKATGLAAAEGGSAVHHAVRLAAVLQARVRTLATACGEAPATCCSHCGARNASRICIPFYDGRVTHEVLQAGGIGCPMYTAEGGGAP